MILGFFKAFKPKILRKVNPKIHTVRIDLTNRWVKDKIIHFAIGVRTKYYECFLMGVCTGTQDIYFCKLEGILQVIIDNRIIEGEELLQFAINDGFDTVEDLWKWFEPLLTADHQFYDGYLEAKIIHWTDFRYPKLGV